MILQSLVTIFIPEQMKNRKNGKLYGRYSTAFGSSAVEEACVIVLSSLESQPEYVLGCIGNSYQNISQKFSKEVWLELQTEPNLKFSCIMVNGQNVSHENTTIVMYDSDEICESEIIKKKYTYMEGAQQGDILPYFIDCVLRDEDKFCLQSTVPGFSEVFYIAGILLYILTWIPKITIREVHSFLKEKLDYSSNALEQMSFRVNQFEKLSDFVQKKRKNIESGRLMTMISVDVLLGVAVAYTISHHASVNDIYDSFCNWTKALSSVVQYLLEWLSGAPAGLKLNQPLTQALSAFFSYHVHLWRLYLDLADPLLKGLAWILVWLGMFGLSIQVAILSDLLDLATLHLYCFYVYAARMHMLQISLLGSQWRAFRGRKWNPLKVRIDSDIGSHMSLKRVFTTVVFTLVIFLLPTTTVYYLVFVTLRVSLSALRKLLSLCIWLLNSNPLYLVLLNFLQSNRIKGNVCLTTCDIGRAHSSTLTFRLHIWPTPVTEALEYAKSEVLPVQPSMNWKSFLSSVIFGDELL